MKCISGNYCTETCFQSCARWTSLGSGREMESHSVYSLWNRLLNRPGSCYLTRQPALLHFHNQRVGDRKWETRSYSHRHIPSHWKLAFRPSGLYPSSFPRYWSLPTLFNPVTVMFHCCPLFLWWRFVSRLVTTIFNIYYICLFLHKFHHFFLFSLYFSLFKFCLLNFYTLTQVLIFLHDTPSLT